MSFLLVLVCFVLSSSAEQLIKSREFDESGRRLVVLDDVFESKIIDSLSDLVHNRKTGSVWQYTLHEDEADSLRVQRYADAKWPWTSRINASLIDGSQTGETVRSLVKRFTAHSDYRVSEATGYLIRRGDSVHRVIADNSENSALVVHIELSGQKWRKNDYGESLFYGLAEHPKSGKLEVVEGVHLKRGRVMLWDASIPFTLRPPSMNYAQSRCGLLLFLTQDQSMAAKARKSFEAAHEVLTRRQLSNFVDTRAVVSLTAKEAVKYQKRTFHDSAGRVVALFDKVLDKSDVDRLRKYLVQAHTSFHYQLHDAKEEEYSDNVQWVAGFEVETFVKTNFWKVTQAIAEAVTNRTEWYPYDVALNVVRSGDFTRIHKDCDGEQEDEYTVLFYINDDVTTNSHGETAFFNEVEPRKTVKSRRPQYADMEEGEEMEEEDEEEEVEEGAPGQEGEPTEKVAYDLFTAVQPKHGRIVIFHGAIPHSARPPSTDYHNIRYSFAVKLSANEQVAKAKALREVLEGGYSREVRHLTPQQQILHQRLVQGQMNVAERHHLPDVPELNELLHRERANLLMLRQSQRKAIESSI